MNNNQYKDHGAAIYFGSRPTVGGYNTINIINCTFSYNRIAKSIIYFQGNNYVYLNTYFKFPQ